MYLLYALLPCERAYWLMSTRSEGNNTSIVGMLYTSCATLARCTPSFPCCPRIWTLSSSARVDLKGSNRWTDNSATASESAEQQSRSGSGSWQTTTLATETLPGTTTTSPSCQRMVTSSTS